LVLTQERHFTYQREKTSKTKRGGQKEKKKKNPKQTDKEMDKSHDTVQKRSIEETSGVLGVTSRKGQKGRNNHLLQSRGNGLKEGEEKSRRGMAT